MVLGWDHLLFIVGVVLLGRSLRNAVKLISLFVLGHSLTLLVATLAGWQVDATAVDVVIALSVAFVGLTAIRLGRAGRGRVPASVSKRAALVATTSERTLTCTSVDAEGSPLFATHGSRIATAWQSSGAPRPDLHGDDDRAASPRPNGKR